MVIQKLDPNTLNQIFHGEEWEFFASSLQLRVMLCRESGKLALKAQIYQNSEGIPKPIEACLNDADKIQNPGMHTQFLIDRREGAIDLYYLGLAPESIQLLEEEINLFENLAHRWLYYLEDHDPREYAYIRTSRG